MAGKKMPNIYRNSRQYLFKNKLNKRRKTKRELFKESSLMMVFGLFLLLINYLIPQKFELFNTFKKNIFAISKNISEIMLYTFEILIVFFISFTFLLSLFLIAGSLFRLVKVILPKSRKINIR